MEATCEEKAVLVGKVDELVKINNSKQQHQTTDSELLKLRDENLSLTTENNQLKIQKLQLGSGGANAKMEIQSLTMLLDDAKERNQALQDELTAQLANQRDLQSELNQVRSAVRSPDMKSTNQKLEQEVKDLRKVKELLERQMKELADSGRSMRHQITS